ncbi:MAG: 30S ribosomal protein S20 [Armatimonadota bacterium]
MPNIKSVKKDVKRSRLNHEKNVAMKSRIKTIIKTAKSVIATGDQEAVVKSISAVDCVLDRAAEKNIIHRNAAARRKSRLMKAANKAKAAV